MFLILAGAETEDHRFEGIFEWTHRPSIINIFATDIGTVSKSTVILSNLFCSFYFIIIGIFFDHLDTFFLHKNFLVFIGIFLVKNASFVVIHPHFDFTDRSMLRH